MRGHRFPRLLPRRLRWRLVSGFALIVAVLLTLLTAAERLILEQSLRTALTGSMETTIHAGLTNTGGSGVLPLSPDALRDAILKLGKMLGADPSTAGTAPQDLKNEIVKGIMGSQTAQLQSLTGALVVADQPVAMLDTGGAVLAGQAILSSDRRRANHLNGAVLADLTRVAAKHAYGLTRPWTTQVSTKDGPYLLLLEPTDLAIIEPGQPLDTRWLSKAVNVLNPKTGQISTTSAPQKGAVLLTQPVIGRNRLVVMMAHSLTDTEGTVSTVTMITIGGALVVLILAGVLSLLVVGTALRPLGAITDGAERLARGDYAHRLALSVGDDEVGRLAAAFDRMAAAIGAAFATQRRFVADASHELRTPLTALRGYTDVLLMGAGESPVEDERILRAMQEDLGRMSRLVNDLLTLARLDGGAPLRLDRVDLSDLLVAAANEGAVIARGARRIVLEAMPAGMTVWGDRDRLRQVLSNLVGNACMYTQYGGGITLRAVSQDHWAVLDVEDDGPGIAPADLERLGERFYRGDSARGRQTGGAGLGIAIARGIVRAHGGSLAIRSALGQGTTVTIRLPLAPPARSAVPPTGRPPA